MNWKSVLPFCILILLLGCRKATGPDNRAPYKPHDPEPLDGSIDQPVNGILLWEGGDPDGDPVNYDIYFGTDASPSIVSGNVSIPEYDPGLLDTFTVYYWMVVSRDTHGVEARGNVWQFATGNNPPYVPNNPVPPDSAIDQSILSTLAWSGGDPDGDTVTYYLYFGTAASPPWIATLDTTGYDPGSLSYNTEYHWKVVSRDKYNNIAESPVWSFSTWDTLPLPQNVSIRADTEGDGIELTWTQASNIDGYEVTTPEYDTLILSPIDTNYVDDAPMETGSYTVCTFRGTLKSGTVSVSSRPFVGTYIPVIYVWSDPVEPAGFGWDTIIGNGMIYDCIDENRDSVDFFLNDSTEAFDFTSADQLPYLGNKATELQLVGSSDFFEAPSSGYSSSVPAQANRYYAMRVEGDYYAKVRISGVVPGLSVSFTFEFQKIQHLRIF